MIDWAKFNGDEFHANTQVFRIPLNRTNSIFFSSQLATRYIDVSLKLPKQSPTTQTGMNCIFDWPIIYLIFVCTFEIINIKHCFDINVFFLKYRCNR